MQSYLHAYLEACGKTCSLIGSQTGLDELLNYTGVTSTHLSYVDDNGQVDFDSSKIVNNIDELRSRIINIIIPTTLHCVAKYPPVFEKNQVELSNSVLVAFDKIVVLKRLDSIAVTLSMMLAGVFNLYCNRNNDNQQLDMIKFSIANPVILDPVQFKHYYNWNESFVNDNYKQFYQHLNYVDITYDQLIRVRDDSDFCKLIKVPYVPFILPTIFYSEFSNNKQLMVKNMQELLDCIK